MGALLCADPAAVAAASSHSAGIALMEAGSFEQAQACFAQALHLSKHDAASREAQYLAAVCLCKASACLAPWFFCSYGARSLVNNMAT